jgi:glutathione S-transferase
MKLYSAPLSLFARKVEIALYEKHLPFERVEVPFTQSEGYRPKNPDVLAANPKGQVPVLLDGDLTLYDSTVILEYLEDAYPDPPLYPATPADRAKCRLLEVFADEILLAPVRALMYRTGPRWGDQARQAAEDASALAAEPVIAGYLADLDAQLSDREYFCDVLTVADIALFTTVLYGLRLGSPALTGHPRLAAWYTRLRDRPAFSRVRAEILAADRALSVPVDRPGEP